MLEYAPVLHIVRRGIFKNKIVWLQDFRAIPQKKNLDIVRNFAKSCQHTIFWLFAYGAVLPKGGIYHIKHMYIQPFTKVADWPEILCSMEVSAMFYICRYCISTWWGRYCITVYRILLNLHSWMKFQACCGICYTPQQNYRQGMRLTV